MPHNLGRTGLEGRRVLLVEDDYIIAQDLATELQSAGAVVVGPVATIERALGLLASGANPDCAVLDINLGGQMVYPLVDLLLDRGVTLLFTTGYEAWSIPERFWSVPRLEKPLSMVQVAAALAAAALRRDRKE